MNLLEIIFGLLFVGLWAWSVFASSRKVAKKLKKIEG